MGCKKIYGFMLLIFAAALIPLTVNSDISDVDYVYSALTEEALSKEPADAITQNLDLSLSGLVGELSVIVSFTSSNTDVLRIEGTTGVVTRQRYDDVHVTLSAVVSEEGGYSRTKNFEFVILRSTTKIYMSDNFYYPDSQGSLIIDVPGILTSPVTPVPYPEQPEGWSFSYYPVSGRYKSLIEKKDSRLVLKSIRDIAMEEYNYTRYVFGSIPDKKVVIKSRIMFENTSLPQMYVLQLYGDYEQSEAEDKSAVIGELKINYYEGSNSVSASYYVNGTTAELVWQGKAPAADTWAELMFKIDTEAQQMDIYIDNEKLNSAPVPFVERYREDVEREHCKGINCLQFNSFRQYNGGIMYMDDFTVRSDETWYEENKDIFRASEMITFELLSTEDVNSVTSDLNLSLESLQQYLTTEDISVEWESGNEDVILINESTAIVSRQETDSFVTLSAVLSKGSGSIRKSFDLKVLCVPENRKINAVYDMLSEEMLTNQPSNLTTSNLDLSLSKLSALDLTGITVLWSSSDEGVVEIINNLGIVKRAEIKDRDVCISAVITENGNAFTRTKHFYYTIPSKKTYIHYSDNFGYPAYLNRSITDVPNTGWSFSIKPSSVRFQGVVAKENENFIFRTFRNTANSVDYNFCNMNLKVPAKKEAVMKTKMKFDHTVAPQIYILQFYGDYSTSAGAQTVQLVELQFHYTRIINSVSVIYYSGAESVTKTLTTSLPPAGKWFDLEIRLDAIEQTWGIYIDGKRLGGIEPMPFYEKDRSGVDRTDFREIKRFSFNSYRYYPGGAICFDDFSIRSEGGLAPYYKLKSNNVTVSGVEELIAQEADANILLYNFYSEEKSVSISACVYKDNMLYSIKNSTVTLGPNAAKVPLDFNGISIPQDKTNVKIKLLFWDNGQLNPLTPPMILENRLNEKIIPAEAVDALTGRVYKTFNLYGRNAVRGYFTAQCWSADNTRFYFRDNDNIFYEYNINTGQVKYIDKGLYEHTIVSTPQNNLFYLNKNREIIKMNIDTHERIIVAQLPEWQTERAIMMQVNDAETKMTFEWKDSSGEINPEYESRLPILDLTTGEWDLRWKYGFDTPWYAPNHMCINPVYENLMFFIHEGDLVSDRIWVLDTDTGSYYNAFEQMPYNSNQTGEIVCHEAWSYDGERIVFVKNKSKTSQIGISGICSVKYNGKDRKYYNDDYDYNHCAGSPVTDRWIVADTAYGDGYTNIVLVDCYTGDSHLLARVRQSGKDPGHAHPSFSQDGMAVWFSVYDESYETINIAWMNISDIVTAELSGGIEELSQSCDTFSYEGYSSYLSKELAGGSTVYCIPQGNEMNVNVRDNICEGTKVNARIDVTYYDSGFGAIALDYLVWELNSQGNNSLKPKRYLISCLNTKKIKTASFTIQDINLTNMMMLGTDFKLSGTNGDVFISSVSVTPN